MRDDGVHARAVPRHLRPTRRTPAAGSTARTSRTRPAVGSDGRGARPGSTSSGTTSTTPASSSRSSTPPSRPWPQRRRRRPDGALWCSPRTRSRSSGATTSGPEGGAYVAQHRAAAGSSPTRSRRAYGVEDRRGTWSSSRGPGRRRSRGSSPTSATTSRPCAAAARPGAVHGPDRLRLRPRRGRLGPRHGASTRADALGLPVARAATPGTDPRFVAHGPRARPRARRRRRPGRCPPLGPTWDVCPTACCPNPAAGAPRPARLAGTEVRSPAAARRALGQDRARAISYAPALLDELLELALTRRARPRTWLARGSAAGRHVAGHEVDPHRRRHRDGPPPRRCWSAASSRPARDDGLLGEEGADHVPATTGLRWVIDPLDGTVNYLYGLPGWAVSRRRRDRRGRAVVGVVVRAALRRDVRRGPGRRRALHDETAFAGSTSDPVDAARGPARHRLRLHRRAPRRRRRAGGRAGAAAGAGHPRGGSGSVDLCSSPRAARRLLRAGPPAVGPRGRRPHRHRGRRAGRRSARRARRRRTSSSPPASTCSARSTTCCADLGADED